ncbi:uncharacterized protein LOC130962384 [Arachis stenosperma]|uniref:uncharacterized protein LOC130962384 n=1 Tax=Arachis stenosperma TaxID=217475 RepID=UPI0025AC466D|nr:uncharacterized protein LOC130962384 [Arachis stenosperma]
MDHNRGRRPFHFLAAWLTHPDFGNVVNNSWNIQTSWTEGLSTFKDHIKDWNRSMFGNIFKRKQKILRRLQGITSSLIYNSNPFLDKLQQDLWREYEDILIQEEILWFQKSRCKWIEFGDRNTKFFHGSTMIRRRRNKIVSLQDDNGNWVTDKATLENIFNQPDKIGEVNETLITLIPKVDHVTHLKQLRPISLSLFWGDTVPITSSSPKKSSTLCDKKKGKKGWMAIKIDLEKAYDRLKWSFISDTLMDIGLPQMFIKLILNCISTAKMRVLWNGEELEEFSPLRGIRQGDPISPYIFVLCIERLSQLIGAAMDHKFWKPIRLKKDGPPISHLCFADDLILFAEASLDQANVINKCLETFCESSGQKVSKEKTRIFFSKNVGHNVRTEISNTLQFARTDDLGKYLGVPIFHSKVSRNTFEDIINKLNTRLNSWKASSLSLAGRVTLSAYLPSSTCDMIDRKCRNFFWGDTEQSKKIHLLNWKKVYEPKNSGGLGIRHASQMNKAFMMKAGWGLVEKKDALWVRILRSKYGSGNNVIPRVERKRSNSNLWKGICQLWPEVQRHWDTGKLQELLPEDVVKKIVAISPPSPWKGTDHLAWGLTPDGLFNTKSAYQSLSEGQHTPNIVFRQVWNWQGPERIRTFLWLVAHNALLTNSERRRRHLTNDDSCPRCHHHDETVIHVLRDCSYAQCIWKYLLPLPPIL